MRDGEFDSTPLGWAIHLHQPQLTQYFADISSDIFALVTVGAVSRLRSVLDAQPSLAQTVRNDATPLFRPSEADEHLGIEIAELLLARGANPKFKKQAREDGRR